MADGARPSALGRRIPWRTWLRAVHRDTGYTAVGLTFVYALSGLAVNHVAEWDPNFHNYEQVHELGAAVPGDDGAASRAVMERLGVKETPREVYRASEQQLDVVFDKHTLHVDTTTGRVVDEGQKPRFLLRAANWLHLNRGKKAWTYAADSYAAALLFLATSGMFMLPGRKGLFGRGIFFVAVGVAIPILYVTFASP